MSRRRGAGAAQPRTTCQRPCQPRVNSIATIAAERICRRRRRARRPPCGEANGRAAVASTLTSSAIDPNPVVGLLQRDIELVAPEIDHVNETLATPVPMTDMHYADMTEPEGYLDNAAELGPLANRIMLESDLVAPPRYDRFIVRSPMLVASR